MSIVEDARAPANPRLIRLIVYVLAAVGAGLGVLAEFVDAPAVAVVAMAVPLIVLGLALSAAELFEVKSRRSRGFNFLLLGPALTLMFSAFAVKLVSFGIPMIASAGGLVVGAAVAAVAMRRPGLLAPRVLPLFGAMFGACYGFGAAVIVDTRFDPAPPKLIRTTVEDTFYTHGKGTLYYVKLPAWGPKTGPDSVDVSEALYRTLSPGDDVCIQLHPGVLGAPWFTIDKCAVQSGGPANGVMAPIKLPDFTEGFTNAPPPPPSPPGQ